MLTEIGDELLELTASEHGRTRARYALRIALACCCSSCGCLFFC